MAAAAFTTAVQRAMAALGQGGVTALLQRAEVPASDAAIAASALGALAPDALPPTAPHTVRSRRSRSAEMEAAQSSPHTAPRARGGSCGAEMEAAQALPSTVPRARGGSCGALHQPSPSALRGRVPASSAAAALRGAPARGAAGADEEELLDARSLCPSVTPIDTAFSAASVASSASAAPPQPCAPTPLAMPLPDAARCRATSDTTPQRIASALRPPLASPAVRAPPPLPAAAAAVATADELGLCSARAAALVPGIPVLAQWSAAAGPWADDCVMQLTAPARLLLLALVTPDSPGDAAAFAAASVTLLYTRPGQPASVASLMPLQLQRVRTSPRAPPCGQPFLALLQLPPAVPADARATACSLALRAPAARPRRVLVLEYSRPLLDLAALPPDARERAIPRTSPMPPTTPHRARPARAAGTETRTPSRASACASACASGEDSSCSSARRTARPRAGSAGRDVTSRPRSGSQPASPRSLQKPRLTPRRTDAGGKLSSSAGGEVAWRGEVRATATATALVSAHSVLALAAPRFRLHSQPPRRGHRLATCHTASHALPLASRLVYARHPVPPTHHAAARHATAHR